MAGAPREKPRGGPRLLEEHPLRVAPALLGQPLASPARRLAALVLDLMLLVLPSLAVAVAVALLFLHHERPATFRALTGMVFQRVHGPEETRQAWRDLAPWLAEMHSPGLPAEAAEAAERGDLDGAASILQSYDIMVALSLEEAEGEARPPKGQILVQLEKVIPRPLRWFSFFGLAALYFTLMTSGRKGATLGKRAVGIRVAHLGGERIGKVESFERFAGYLEIPASFGLALAALWKDPNRRMPHDKVAGTVVLRVGKPPRPPKAAKAAAKPKPASAKSPGS